MALNPLSIFAGPSPLPPQVGTVTNQYAPTQYAQGQQAIEQGSALTAGGTSALQMAQAGQLTPEQQAQLDVYSKGLKNTALQEYSRLGIAPNKSTSFISTMEDIDTKTLAMAQSFIQSTIALGGAELSAGASFVGLGQQAEDAASKELLATAQMQITQDQAYSKLIGDTLRSIATVAAAAAAPATGGLSLAALAGSSAAYGGGNILSGDAYGGSASDPLSGLTAADYG